MPPIYSPWLKAFEAVGRFGFFRRGGPMDGLSIGDRLQETDCQNDVGWRKLCAARALFDAWSPPPASPWSGYAKPTLFAAVDDFGSLGNRMGNAFGAKPTMNPSRPACFDPHLAPAAPRLAKTAVVLDLPGPQAVAHAALLARRGMQPVVLFNNWPHSRGLVRMGDTLGALLYFGPWAQESPAHHDPAAMPVFVLDRGRLGPRLPVPEDFDNRYYHPDADLPSAATLARAGVERVVYVHPDPSQPQPPKAEPDGWIPVPQPGAAPQAPPGSDPKFEAFIRALTPPPTPPPGGGIDMDDLNPILVAWSKRLPIAVARADPASMRLGAPEPFKPMPRATPFNTSTDPAYAGFRRSSAGGFGRMVPTPNSGGG